MKLNGRKKKSQMAMPLMENLEPRMMLSGTSYIVNTLADTVADDGVLSLREAIQASNTNAAVNEAVAGSSSETDIITFDQTALQAEAGEGNPLVIVLGGQRLRISDNLDIQGLGDEILTIDANEQSTVFQISGEGKDVSISDLTLTGGNDSGIYGYGTLSIFDCTISGNNRESEGGGISWMGGTLIIENSIISDNTSTGYYSGGGGIFCEYSTLILSDTIVRDNIHITSRQIDELGQVGGGGICLSGSTLTGSNIEITGNTTNAAGGGICMIDRDSDSSIVTLSNATIAGNTALQAGGIYAAPGSLAIINNCIVSQNTADKYENLFGAVTGWNNNTNNLIDATAEEVGFVDPENGDYQLSISSVAINAGDNQQAVSSDLTPLVVDLAGNTRIASGTVDIGAYENQSVQIAFDDSGRAIYQDADGDNVTVTLKGGGTGYVLLDGDTGDAVGIFLSNTTSKTSLSFSVKVDKVNGGTGYTTIGGIEADGLIKSIKGKTVNLSGEILLNTDGDIIGERDSTSLTFAAIEDSAIDTNGLPIKSLTVANWIDSDDTTDTITVPWIASISVKSQKDNRKTTDVDESLAGDFDADLILSEADSKDYALKKATAKGEWQGDINAADNYIGSIKVGVWNADILAGYLKSLTTKSVKNTDIDGDAAGNITISSVDAKGNAIDKLTVKGSADGLNIDAGDGMIKSIAVGEWTDGSLVAGVLKTIKTKADKHREDVDGDLGIDITLDPTWYNASFKPAKATISSAKIANDIIGGTWNVTGDFGSLSAKGQTDGLILNVFGNAKSLTFGGLFDSQIDIDGELNKVYVKGWKVAKGEEIPVFTSGSTIAADYIKSAKLTNWDTTDMTQLVVPGPVADAPAFSNVGKLSYKDTRPDSKQRWSWKPGQEFKWDEALQPITYSL